MFVLIIDRLRRGWKVWICECSGRNSDQILFLGGFPINPATTIWAKVKGKFIAALRCLRKTRWISIGDYIVSIRKSCNAKSITGAALAVKAVT
jgi:hypothetical protein